MLDDDPCYHSKGVEKGDVVKIHRCDEIVEVIPEEVFGRWLKYHMITIMIGIVLVAVVHWVIN